ncbi:MAG TPA: sugar ABC transporter permease [Firmicutes bacterium]|nr:sugar ABC transporter permease [Bacillota bacterium]
MKVSIFKPRTDSRRWYTALDWDKVNGKLFPYYLLAPSLIIIFGLTIYPIFYSFGVSLLNYNLLIPGKSFAGLGNYMRLFMDSEFWASLGRTLYFAMVSIAVQITLGMIVALVLDQRFVGRGWTRAIVLLPWGVPTIVNGILWKWIYQPNYGALNGLLYQLGFIKQYMQWLSDPWLAMHMIIIADTWKVLGFYVVLFLASLQSIPSDIYESARVDGASPIRQFIHITLPMLRPTFLLILVMRTLETFRVFDIIYALTQGGPANGTKVIGYMAYEETFRFLDFGRGAAVSIVITLLVAAFSLLYIRMFFDRDVQFS